MTTDEQIRDLRLDGFSERQIAAELGITRHRVRTVLEDFSPPVRAAGGATWVENVELALARARFRGGETARAEQIALGELAFHVAEWLDANGLDADGNGVYGADQIAVSLRNIVEGCVQGSSPLVRLHARCALRRIATAEGRDFRAVDVSAWK
jgi:hypothetical protein